MGCVLRKGTKGHQNQEEPSQPQGDREVRRWEVGGELGGTTGLAVTPVFKWPGHPASAPKEGAHAPVSHPKHVPRFLNPSREHTQLPPSVYTMRAALPHGAVCDFLSTESKDLSRASEECLGQGDIETSCSPKCCCFSELHLWGSPRFSAARSLNLVTVDIQSWTNSCCEGCSGTMFSSIAGFYPLDANSTHQS